MDGMLRQSFLPSGRQQNSKVTENNNIGNILRSIQEEHMNLGNFSGCCNLVNADASNEHLVKSERKPNLLQQSIRSIMNPYVGEARRGQNLSNYHCSNYGILGLSFSPVNPFLSYPFCQEYENRLYELEPQSQLFYMQNENFSMVGNSCFIEPTKVKFKLNPEAKEYIPIALLSQVKRNFQPVIDSTVNYPQTAVIFESTDSDYGFIRENFNDELKDCCSCNNISTSKQISSDMCEKACNNFYDSESSKVNILKDKNSEHLDFISKSSTMKESLCNFNIADKRQSQMRSTEMTEGNSFMEVILEKIPSPDYRESLDVNNFDSVSADSPQSQVNNTEMTEGNNYMENIPEKITSPDFRVSLEVNNFDSVSVVDSKTHNTVDVLAKGSDYVYSTSDNDISDESGDDYENKNSDSSDEEEAVTFEESDSSDDNDEFFEGLKSDESFNKFGSIDSNDSNIGSDCKNANGIKGSGSDSVKAKSSIFSFVCNPDSDSESCNAEDSDYDYDIFSVQLDDGWDLSCGGLEISAFISHCSPDINARDSSNSDFSVVDSKVLSDCTILCCDETCNIGGEELEIIPDFALINEKWEEEIDKNLSLRTHTKVSFRDDVEIHSSVEWDRHGPWEQYARDRMRFARRIEETEPILSKVLTPEHRLNILQKLTKL